MRMIVIGADTHKDTHTAVAVAEGTGQLVGELTAPARKAGFAQHLDWAHGLDPERVWAVEDCRHVSGGLERFLVASGERLRWHLHQLFPEFEIPAGALDRMVWLDRIARKLSRAPQGARVRVARELLRSIRSQVRRAGELEREITALVKAKAPGLLALPGCGSLVT